MKLAARISILVALWSCSFVLAHADSALDTSKIVMVTAGEINPVLSALVQKHFEIEGVHNHMSDEQPRVFFVHYWKIGTPAELAEGLKAALAAVHVRSK